LAGKFLAGKKYGGKNLGGEKCWGVGVFIYFFAERSFFIVYSQNRLAAKIVGGDKFWRGKMVGGGSQVGDFPQNFSL